jgi:hypothetical protein
VDLASCWKLKQGIVRNNGNQVCKVMVWNRDSSTINLEKSLFRIENVWYQQDERVDNKLYAILLFIANPGLSFSHSWALECARRVINLLIEWDSCRTYLGALCHGKRTSLECNMIPFSLHEGPIAHISPQTWWICILLPGEITSEWVRANCTWTTRIW